VSAVERAGAFCVFAVRLRVFELSEFGALCVFAVPFKDV
jgi:hypothetical protein